MFSRVVKTETNDPYSANVMVLIGRNAGLRWDLYLDYIFVVRDIRSLALFLKLL